jgi:hypothetical protein
VVFRLIKTVKSTIIWIVIIIVLLPVSSLHSVPISHASPLVDYNPLVDKIYVTVTLKEIRALDRDMRFIDLIDPWKKPDFYVVISINGNQSKSPVWHNMMYVKNPGWSATCNVPKDVEKVTVKIQLWNSNPFGQDALCKISGNHQGYPLENEANLVFSLKTGHWTGDDQIGDLSGYGCLNGCDDNSQYTHDKNCELRFDITQTDPTGDGIPYWAKKYVYHLDPTQNYSGFDPNNDSIPIPWDWKWEYNPTAHDNHSQLDPDFDGLTNLQEYRASHLGSDPFRKDIFLELEQMEKGPNGEGVYIPELSKDMIIDAFAKQKIAFHIQNGTALIPFQENVTMDDLQNIYLEYFLQGNPDNWKRGVFHCGIITYHCTLFHGFTFASEVRNKPTYVDSFQVATKEHEVIPYKYPVLRLISRKSLNKDYNRAIIYGSAIMHETGHVLGINHGNTPGCDNQTDKFPWEKNWWVWRNYRSVMNYGWMYTFIDYSNGSRGKNDFDDWARIDLTYFNQPRG